MVSRVEDREDVETEAEQASIRRRLQDGIASRVPFFYGWVMLPIVLAVQVASSPGQTFGVSIFNPHIRAELAASSTGRLLMGGCHDLFGSFNTILIVFTAITAPMVTVTLFATPPADEMIQPAGPTTVLAD